MVSDYGKTLLFAVLVNFKKEIMNQFKNIAIASFLILFVIIGVNKTNASHIISGAIEYTHLSGDDYLVEVNFFHDCSGISAAPSVAINVESNLCSITNVVTLPLISYTEVTPDCPSAISTCPSFGGMGSGTFGVGKTIYSDTVTLIAGCSDFKLSYSSCCRNGIVNAQPGFFYTETFLNTLIAPQNSSPKFNVDPIFIMFQGQPHNFTMGTNEPDGDFVRYSITAPLSAAGTPLPFNPPNTFANPIPASAPLTLNNSNGNMSITPTAIGGHAFAVLVEEIRYGIVISSIIRDMQVQIIQDTTNAIPAISGFGGIGSTNYLDTICLTDTINHSIFAHDPNLNDTITIRTVNTGSGTPIASTIGIGIISTNFYWSPVFAGITTPGNYTFTVEIKDNACPYVGIATYTYNVVVLNCAATDSVWPGDANSDLVANAWDLLNIGLAYGSGGPTRGIIGNAWMGHFSNNWLPSFLSGVNYKHADCNGSGTVDSLDALAIALNYGLTHTKGSAAAFGPNDPNLTIEFANDTVFESDTVTATINLGDIGIPVNSIYGIAFKLNYNPMLVKDIINADYSNSWLGSSNDILNIEKVFVGNGTMDIGITRINHLNTTGFGEILKVDFVIEDNIDKAALQDMFQTMTVNVSDILAVEANENELVINTSNNDIVLRSIINSVDEEELLSDIKIYPTPASTTMQFDFGNISVEKVELVNVDGKVVFTSYGNATSIDVSPMADGVYVARIHTPTSILNKKVLVSH